ncbi:MAG: carboxypeptidase regulatory-like domain-containing protein, partial [Myxococcota bacterium]
MIFAVVFLLGTAWAQAPADDGPRSSKSAAATSDLSVVLFEDGLPVPGVSIVVEGELVGTTDDSGSTSAPIASGRQYLQMFRGDDPLVELDLLTLTGEVVQVIVTLVPGQDPRLDIETSSDSLPLASEREDQPVQVADDPADALPPGALVGRILSADDQRPVARARVFFTGTDVETRTDNDGEFAVELPAGTYSVSVVHPNFSTQTLDNIRVIAEQEVTANIELTPAGIQLQEYVVTAPYVEGSISEMLAQQRETSSVVEVLGAEQMSAAGDSDAAEALQRVSGLTVEQGKFVLVRGQPYRYTFTLWNGSPLPSPEPLVRVVPLDLFPTGVLSGIEVQKSYSADLPAGFGAGLINLQTRGVPEEAFLDLNISTNFNSVSTFNNGLTY